MATKQKKQARRQRRREQRRTVPAEFRIVEAEGESDFQLIADGAVTTAKLDEVCAAPVASPMLACSRKLDELEPSPPALTASPLTLKLALARLPARTAGGAAPMAAASTAALRRRRMSRLPPAP